MRLGREVDTDGTVGCKRAQDLELPGRGIDLVQGEIGCSLTAIIRDRSHHAETKRCPQPLLPFAGALHGDRAEIEHLSVNIHVERNTVTALARKKVRIGTQLV